VDQGTWSRAEIRFDKLEASGTVADGTPDQRLGTGGSRTWQLTLQPPTLGQRLTTTINRKTSATLKPTAQLQVSDQLFDHIDWSKLPVGPTPIPLGEQPEIVRQLTENLAQSTFTLRLDAP
jgi:hypothetical protein